MIKIKFIHKPGYNNWLKDNGYSEQDEAKVYDDQLIDIIQNTRWYLDNLDFMSEYKVSWGCYTKKKGSYITTPYKFVNKR